MILAVSLILNGVLLFGIYSKLISLPATIFYSTNGVTPPVKLTALSEPNYSSTALLPSLPTAEKKPSEDASS